MQCSVVIHWFSDHFWKNFSMRFKNSPWHQQYDQLQSGNTVESVQGWKSNNALRLQVMMDGAWLCQAHSYTQDFIYSPLKVQFGRYGNNFVF